MTYWRMQRNHWKTSRKHSYERWTSNFHICEKVTILAAKSAVFIAHTDIISRSAKYTKLASPEPLLLKLSSENQILLDFWRLQSSLLLFSSNENTIFSQTCLDKWTGSALRIWYVSSKLPALHYTYWIRLRILHALRLLTWITYTKTVDVDHLQYDTFPTLRSDGLAPLSLRSQLRSFKEIHWGTIPTLRPSTYIAYTAVKQPRSAFASLATTTFTRHRLTNITLPLLRSNGFDPYFTNIFNHLWMNPPALSQSRSGTLSPPNPALVSLY